MLLVSRGAEIFISIDSSNIPLEKKKLCCLLIENAHEFSYT